MKTNKFLSTHCVCLSFIFFATLLFSEETALFSPPPKWECATPLKELSSHLCIGFIGSGKNKFFRPSINLATEEADISLKEYVQAVKKIHLTDPLIQIRDLGSSSCKIGPAHLLEISSKTPYGEVSILQFLCMHNRTAYVLTASVLKEESVAFYPDILKCFHSLGIVDDLASPLSKEEKSLLEEKIQELKKSPKEDQKKARKNFENFILHAFKDQGLYWQILVLKKAYEELEKNVFSATK